MNSLSPANVCVIGGAGYVGLITGLGLSELGHQVINVDIDAERIQRLKAGDSPLYENGIESALQRNLDRGNIKFTTDFGRAVGASQVVFIAVGTPALNNGHVDLSQMHSVAGQLADNMDEYKLIVIKSTVPAGTMEIFRDTLGKGRQEGQDFDLAVNPEFLREGHGLHDFFYPDRIVIGATSENAVSMMRSLYQPLIDRDVPWESERIQPDGPVPVIETDPVSAQMIKYSSNAFLAARVSFINEIADLCGRVGADIGEVSRGMGYDPRIGHTYLQPGLGFGGPCLEKDLSALIHLSQANDHEPELLKAVLARNEQQMTDLIVKLKALCGDVLGQKTLAVFGLAFKAGTNDIRNSLAIKLVDHLTAEGAIIRAHDPVAASEVKAIRPDIVYCDDPYAAVDEADALLVLTEWPEFKKLDYKRIKDLMACPRILDGRNLLDRDLIAGLGYTYVSVGRS